MDNGGPLLIALSADGVQIAHVRIGHGRPLVVVGGALYDHRRWLPVARLLSQQATVYVMDRRGRGGSGDDAATYAPEREVDDIAAVQRPVEVLICWATHWGCQPAGDENRHGRNR